MNQSVIITCAATGGIHTPTMSPYLPTMLFHLGAGPGGMEEICNRYRDSFHRWWKDLGEVELTPELSEKLADGVDAEANGKAVVESATERAALIVAMLKSTSGIRAVD